MQFLHHMCKDFPPLLHDKGLMQQKGQACRPAWYLYSVPAISNFPVHADVPPYIDEAPFKADMEGMFAQAKAMYGELSSQDKAKVMDLEKSWFSLRSDRFEVPDPKQHYPCVLSDALAMYQGSRTDFTLQSAQAKLQAAIDTVRGLQVMNNNSAADLKYEVKEAVAVFQVHSLF